MASFCCLEGHSRAALVGKEFEAEAAGLLKFFKDYPSSCGLGGQEGRLREGVKGH